MTATRYCASPEVIALLNRDGIGWGHDLDCGSFINKDEMPNSGLLNRLAKRFVRRVV